VVGHKKELITEYFNGWPLKFVEQEHQLGTGDAVKTVESYLKDFNGTILVLAGDVPLLSDDTLRNLIGFHEQNNAAATDLTAELPNAGNYGRIIRDMDGKIVKIVEKKDATEEELKIIAPQEASKHIPFTMNEINVDFDILETTKENKLAVILCALSKTIAKNLVETLAKADLEVEAITVSSFAMIKALANAEMINNPDLTYISVLIGYENTDINIIKNGMPVFSHNTQTGKKNIVEALMKSFEINKEDAEKRLPEFGLILPGMEINDNPDLHKASNAARNIYSNITSEIQKAIEFYNSQNGENTEIEKIILGGSGVCIQNIDKYISNKLKIQTELCNSLKNISHNLDISENTLYPVNIPALSTSIGLALNHLSP